MLVVQHQPCCTRCCCLLFLHCPCLCPCSDKSVIVWHLERSETQYGFPKRSLIGHNHYVQVCAAAAEGAGVLVWAASSRS